jgi:hypothetical protein
VATINNLFDDDTSFLSSTIAGTGSWTVPTSGDAIDLGEGSISFLVGNGTIQRTSKRAKTGLASLLVTGTENGATTTVISHAPSVALEVEAGERYRAVMWFHHETIGRQIRFGVQFYDAERAPITYAQDHWVYAEQGFKEWTLVYVTVDAPADARYAALRIDMAGVDTSTFDRFLWFDDIGLVTYGIINSRFLDLFSRSIPDWMIIDDADQISPQFPMMRFVDLVGTQMDEIFDLISDFHYIPEAEGGPVGDTSSLVDPANYLNEESEMVTKAEWLPWLSQLVGIRSTSLALESGTSWDYLQSTYPTWTQWENEINSAAATPFTITASPNGLNRTAGLVTVTTTAAHSLVAGDVVTIAGTTIASSAAADVPFNGYYNVLTASGSSFTYSQQYSILSAERSGTTVTVKVGRPHGFVVNNTVTLTDCSVAAFNGTFTVTAVWAGLDDGVDTFTFTTGTSGVASSLGGSVRPATNKTGGGGTATPADLKWSFIEQVDTDGFDPVSLIAEFIRGGANGVWSGTIEGMKRSARLALSGIDVPCVLTRIGGTVFGRTAAAHGIATGATVTVYSASKPSLNRSYTFTSTGSDTFTLPSGGLDLTDVRAWITTKTVSVTKGSWNGTINSVVVGSSNSYTVTFTQPFPATTASGTVTIAGSAATAVNKVHTPTGAITVSADRMSISFTSNQTTSAQSSFGGKAKLAVDDSTFLVGTRLAQSPGDQTIIDFVSVAKPAGGIITHEYTG